MGTMPSVYFVDGNNDKSVDPVGSVSDDAASDGGFD